MFFLPKIVDKTTAIQEKYTEYFSEQ